MILHLTFQITTINQRDYCLQERRSGKMKGMKDEQQSGLPQNPGSGPEGSKGTGSRDIPPVLMLALLTDIKSLWDGEGFGSDDAIPEPLHARLDAAIQMLSTGRA